MKTYIVYDEFGNEMGHIKAGSHNSAEKKAKVSKKFGGKVAEPNKISVAYTEL